MARFDAILFDAGGVLVLPDPLVLGPLLAWYGGDPSIEVHRRAHYAAMKAKSDARSSESTWDVYDEAYVASIGIDGDVGPEATEVLGRTRNHWLWRWPIPETRAALDRLAAAGVPMGVVSNASGQIEKVLNRSVCQVGPGEQVELRVIVDSDVVGVAKPDPAIFDHAVPALGDVDRSRIAYVGDSVVMDVESAAAAGLHPLLLDPHGDHDGADFERIADVGLLVDACGA